MGAPSRLLPSASAATSLMPAHLPPCCGCLMTSPCAPPPLPPDCSLCRGPRAPAVCAPRLLPGLHPAVHHRGGGLRIPLCAASQGGWLGGRVGPDRLTGLHEGLEAAAAPACKYSLAYAAVPPTGAAPAPAFTCPALLCPIFLAPAQDYVRPGGPGQWVFIITWIVSLASAGCEGQRQGVSCVGNCAADQPSTHHC